MTTFTLVSFFVSFSMVCKRPFLHMLSLATSSGKFTFERTDSKITGSKFAEKQNYTLIQGKRTCTQYWFSWTSARYGNVLDLFLYTEYSDYNTPKNINMINFGVFPCTFLFNLHCFFRTFVLHFSSLVILIAAAPRNFVLPRSYIACCCASIFPVAALVYILLLRS